MNPVDIAWFTGLFEGEGCFSIEKNGNTKLAISMTDPDVIDRVKSLFPKCQNMQPIQPKPVRDFYSTPKVRYTWRVSDPDEVRRITEMMLPWLGERRTAKAQMLLEHLATRPGTGSFQRNKTHCAQRHEYTPENTMPRSESAQYRRCRKCYQVSFKKSNDKRSRKRGQVISA